MKRTKILLRAAAKTGLPARHYLNGTGSANTVANDITQKWIDRYLQLRADWGQANPSGRWSYLPVAEWQPNMIELAAAVETVVALQLGSKSEIEDVPVSSLAMADFLIAALEEAGFDARIGWFDRCKLLMLALKSHAFRYVNIVLWCMEELQKLRHLGARKNLAPVAVLCVSRFEPRSFAQSDGVTDVYLGDLPTRLSTTGCRVATLGRLGFAAKELSSALTSAGDRSLCTMYEFLKPKDVLRAAFQALSFKVSTASHSAHLHKAARREARLHVRAFADCRLLETALHNAMDVLRPRHVLCMQENATWERAVALAARNHPLSISTTGLFHCPVMPSALRYHGRSDIALVEPCFDQTVTLGPEASRALRSLGNPPEKLVDGAGFRNPQLNSKISQSPGPDSKRVLVLLGGAFDNIAFVLWLLDALAEHTDIDLVLRPHPSFSPDQLISLLDKQNSGLRISRSTIANPVADISAARCVIYKGTTLGFAALAARVPAIHVQSIGLATDDALFHAQGLHLSVSTKCELSSAVIAVLRGDTPDLKKGPEYVKGYFDLSEVAKARVVEAIVSKTYSQRQ